MLLPWYTEPLELSISLHQNDFSKWDDIEKLFFSLINDTVASHVTNMVQKSV